MKNASSINHVAMVRTMFVFVVEASASLLYLKGDAYMAVGSPTDGPNDAVKNNVLFIHYVIAGEGDLSLDFLTCSWNPPLGMPRRCLVETAPGVACGVACHVAERAV